MQDLRSDAGKSQALLLFLFVFGCFLCILYGESLPRFVEFETGEQWRLIPLILLVDAAFAASVTASLVFPLLTCLFGFLSAFGAEEIAALFSAGDAEWRLKLLVLLLLVPAHFVLSSVGMENASAMREAMRSRGLLTWKTMLFPYAVIGLGPAAVLLIRRVMKI